MLDRRVHDAGRPQQGMGSGAEHQRPALVALLRLQPAVVDRVRDESADPRMHAVAGGQKDAAVRGDRRGAVEQPVQRRITGAAGVHTPHGLTKLHLIAQ